MEMAEAGSESPHLDEKQQRQAERQAPPSALVIHEVVREQGEEELERRVPGLAWSALAAGLSIGFSFVMQAYLQANLPDEKWRPAVAAFGYCFGFLIVVLGRQQLFTETTLTALIPPLTQPSLGRIGRALRVWLVVLVLNLLGTAMFGVISAQPGVFSPEAMQAMTKLSDEAMAQPFGKSLIEAGSAGWLMGLMVWLLPAAAGSARPLIVILLTYAIGLCRFPHVIAGSVEAVFAVTSGHATILDYFTRFLAPALVGNIFGGMALAAVLNHAPVASEMGG
jgi:formate-nitrite transporter family protein